MKEIKQNVDKRYVTFFISKLIESKLLRGIKDTEYEDTSECKDMFCSPDDSSV